MVSLDENVLLKDCTGKKHISWENNGPINRNG